MLTFVIFNSLIIHQCEIVYFYWKCVIPAKCIKLDAGQFYFPIQNSVLRNIISHTEQLVTKAKIRIWAKENVCNLYWTITGSKVKIKFGPKEYICVIHEQWLSNLRWWPAHEWILPAFPGLKVNAPVVGFMATRLHGIPCRHIDSHTSCLDMFFGDTTQCCDVIL